MNYWVRNKKNLEFSIFFEFVMLNWEIVCLISTQFFIEYQGEQINMNPYLILTNYKNYEQKERKDYSRTVQKI